jgi:hypothetical protein
MLRELIARDDDVRSERFTAPPNEIAGTADEAADASM